MGVLGGIGPQATMDFEVRVHAVAQRLIPQRANFGYPPMIVCYLRQPPFVVGADLRPSYPFEPAPGLAELLPRFGQMVDFIVCPANAPHLLQGYIEATTGRPMLSMIDCVVTETRQRGWLHVGVLGLGEPRVYLAPLQAAGVTCEILSGEPGGLRDRLDQAVWAVMEGRASAAETALAAEAVATLRARGVDGVVLGCTEIPLMLGAVADAAELLNPVQLLAEAAVRFAIE